MNTRYRTLLIGSRPDRHAWAGGHRPLPILRSRARTRPRGTSRIDGATTTIATAITGPLRSIATTAMGTAMQRSTA